jgi:Kef-type K+ transport system membrane component KefB
VSAAAESKPRGIAERFSQLLALALVFGLLTLALRAAPGFEGPFGVVSAIGFLLLAGMLASDLLGVIGLPHLTGYILAGIVAGPHVLHFVDHDAVERLQVVNTLALALIALAGGAELRLGLLKQYLPSLSWAMLIHATFGVITTIGAFLAATQWLPFTHVLSTKAVIGVAILWSVVAFTRSPSATLGILAQLRPDGPVSRFALAFIMSSDVVVVVLLTLALAFTRPLIEPGADFSALDLGALGHELVGSFSLGTTLGLLLAIYLRFVGGQLLILLVAVGFGLSEGLRYLHFDPTLTFLVAGFVVANLTAQGPKLLHSVEQAGSVVYVVFFATAGAHLDVPLLQKLWPVSLFLCGSRALITWVGSCMAARIAGDEPVLATWGWSSLVSQAGLTLGLSVVVARAYPPPSFGDAFASLVIAAVAINELVGPVLFKFALDRTGETGKAVAVAEDVPDAAAAEH